MPDIRIKGDNVTFYLTLAGVPEDVQLIIRCSADGDLWASISLEPFRVQDDV